METVLCLAAVLGVALPSLLPSCFCLVRFRLVSVLIHVTFSGGCSDRSFSCRLLRVRATPVVIKVVLHIQLTPRGTCTFSRIEAARALKYRICRSRSQPATSFSENGEDAPCSRITKVEIISKHVFILFAASSTNKKKIPRWMVILNPMARRKGHLEWRRFF